MARCLVSPKTSRKLLQTTLWVCLLVIIGACNQEPAPSERPVKEVLKEMRPLPPLPDLSQHIASVQTALKNAYAVLQANEANAQAIGEASQLFHAHHLELVAVPGYQRAIRKAPDEHRWHYLLGVSAKAVAMDALARQAFEQAYALAPGHAPTAVEWAEFALQDGRFDEASGIFAGIIEKDPDHVMARTGLGQIALAQGQHQKAITHFQQVLAQDPGATMVHYPMSQALAALGQDEAAQSHLAKRGDGRPSMPDAIMESVLDLEMTVQGFRRRGDGALRARNFEAAREHYNQALALDPNDDASYLNRGWARYYSRDGAGAAADWQKLIATSKKPLLKAQAHYNLGQLERAAGRPDQAIENFRKALELHPKFEGAKLTLAEVLRTEGAFAEALELYKAMVIAKPGDPVARLGRSLCLIRTGAYADAVATLEADVAAQPQQPTFYHMLIRLLAAAPVDQLRNGSQALRMMQRLTNDWQVLDSGLAETSAMILAELGRFDEAIRMQQRALALAKKEGEGQSLNARLLANLEGYANKQPCRTPWPNDAPIFSRPSLQPQPVMETNATQN